MNKLLTAVFLLALVTLSPAQQVNDNKNVGFPENGIFTGSDIENVQVNSGNLHIEIPLWSVPGRGVDAKTVLVYDNKGWSIPEPCKGANCVNRVGQAMGHHMTFPLNTPLSYWVGHSDIVVPFCPHPSGSGFLQNVPAETNFMIREPDGTTHHVQPSASGTQACPNYQVLGGDRYATDGSAWILKTNSIPYAKHGGTLNRDTNGNHLSKDPNTGEIVDTLGRHFPASGLSYRDADGTLRSIDVDYELVDVTTHFCQGMPVQNCQEGQGDWSMPSVITLPNGMTYTIDYAEGWGAEPISITLPTGALIEYTWTDRDEGGVIDGSGRRVASRTVTIDGVSRTWTYSYGQGVVQYGSGIITVTDPEGNVTRHTCGGGNGPAWDPNTWQTKNSATCRITKVEHFQGSNTSATPLKTVETQYWAGELVSQQPKRVTTYLNGIPVSRVETDYDSADVPVRRDLNGNLVYQSFTWSNPIEERIFGWEGGQWVLKKRTVTTYKHQEAGATAYRENNVADRPTSVSIYEGGTAGTESIYSANWTGGTLKAKTTYTYDDYVANPMTATSGVPNHHSSFDTAFTTRGNVTKESVWRDVNCASDDTACTANNDIWLETKHWYDDLGNRLKTRDPGGHETLFSYSDSWSGSTNCVTSSSTKAYLTETTNALGHRVQNKYYRCTGQLQGSKDENDILAGRQGNTFTFDSVKRLLTVSKPNPASPTTNYVHTTYTYDDVAPYSYTKVDKIDATQSLTNITEWDGWGRTKKTTLDDPEGDVFGATTYDGLGRAKTVTNPYRSLSDATYGITTNVYDALGRITKVIPPDGTSSANNIQTVYNGNTITVTDQTGRQRRTEKNALDQIVRVWEPSGSGSQATAGAAAVDISGTLQSAEGQPVGGAPGVGYVTISGTIRRYNDCDPPQTCWIYDTGYIRVTVNGVQKEVTYGSTSTAVNRASALAAAINADSSYPVTAAVNATTNTRVDLTAKTTGTATNYTLTVSSVSTEGSFTGTSFPITRSGATLTGGVNGTPGGTIYDAGEVWVQVDAYTAEVPYGQGSTAATIATALAANFNTHSQSPVTASATGATLTLTSKVTGLASNYALSAGSSSTNPSTFPTSSFAASAGSALSGGADADPFGGAWETVYQYDTLGNLTRVDQKGGSANSADWRTRLFTYNSLSQLLKAENPESGTIYHSYDIDGNALTRNTPRPNQINASTRTVTTFFYDALHRLTKKTYSTGEPDVEYFYDGAAASGNTLTINNAKGARSGIKDGSGQTAYSFDIDGAVETERRTIAGITKDIGYQYNLGGMVTKITYPSGRSVDYTYNRAGRSTSAKDVTNNINYVTDVTYAPHGALSTLVNGKVNGGFAGITTANTYTNRLQPQRVLVTTDTLIDFTCATGTGKLLQREYDFTDGSANNGNVMQIKNCLNDDRTQNFTYDQVNRIATAWVNGSEWGETYIIDPWGNLTKTDEFTEPGEGAPKANHGGLNTTALGANQLVGSSYDAAGNMLTNGGANHQFGVENKLTAVAGFSYLYDGDGERVKKTDNSSDARLYFTGSTSDPLSETNASGTVEHDYIFFNGARVARYDPGGPGSVHFFFGDHLGSTGLTTNANGSVKEEESDYYPFGTERVYIDTDPDQNYKFTGKERDAESGLDYFVARHYSSALGRFLQPDEFTSGPKELFSSNDPFSASPLPYAAITNPQSLNKYAYTYNNPLRYTDPNGHDVWDVLAGAAEGTANFVVNTVQAVGETAIALAKDAGSPAPINTGQLLAEPILTAAQEYGEKGASGVGNALLDQGEQGAMAVLTEAVLTGGATAYAAKGPIENVSGTGAGSGIAPYNRQQHYGNPSGSPAAKQIRSEGAGKACPSCGETMTPRGKNAVTAQHEPTLKQHYYQKGHKMTPKERRAYARSKRSMSGATCKRCQSSQGGKEKGKKYTGG